MIFLLIAFTAGTFFLVRETFRMGVSKTEDHKIEKTETERSLVPETEPDASKEEAPKGSEEPEVPAPNTEPTNTEEPSTEKTEAETGESSGKEPPAPSKDADRRLKPGTNHNLLAEAYAYHPEDVRRWLKNGDKEADYPKEKLVFLTIDDGPILETGTEMLDTLEREGVGATFFYQGSHVAEMNREQMKRVIGIGSSIAVHSYSHDYKLLYPNRIGDTGAILADYDRALKVMKEVLGEDFAPKSYRYPGGHMSWKKLDEADAGLLAKGVHWIDWNISVADSVPNVDRLPVEVFMNNVREGTEKLKGNVLVLLMHETHRIDPPLLEEIIRYYKGLGYRFGILK